MAPWWPWSRREPLGGPTSGEPTSANGASSFHLAWHPAPSEPLVEVAAVLEVVVPPTVERLYFWALQVTFLDGTAHRGVAHLGLQWNRNHPGSGAVNWGGYAPGGGLLVGTASDLPSAPADANTRDYPWQPGRPYRLSVTRAPGPPGRWRGEVTDLHTGRATVVRDLEAAGDRLGHPLVWSEVFARCEHPSVTARWSGFEAVTVGGDHVTPEALSVNYQARAEGGCDNTTVVPDASAVLQITNAERSTPQGSVVHLHGP